MLQVKAYINISNLKHNLYQIQRLAPTSRILACLKANAYGHGTKEIATALENADAFSVARVEEALNLRDFEKKKNIVVLEGFLDKQELKKAAQNNITCTVHTKEQLEILEKSGLKEKINVFLKIDTGLNRIGIKEKDFSFFFAKLQKLKFIKDISFMSHFIASENKETSSCITQLMKFKKITKNLDNQKSIANSAAIMSYPKSHLDWVRPGLMLYGGTPFMEKNSKEFNLKPVMNLCARIIAIKEIKQGQGVGYNHIWKSDKKTKIATISIGYADGYPRSAQVGTPVYIKGEMFSLVGRVSMDMITVDLGVSRSKHIKVGDEVQLWGDKLDINQVAYFSDTIPHQLLASVSARVKRVSV